MKNKLISNTIYLMLAIVFLTVGAYVQHKHMLGGLLITEYIIILLPILICGYLFKLNNTLSSYFRLNPTKFKNLILSVKVTLAIYPVLVFLNMIAIVIMDVFIKIKIPQIPMPQTKMQYITYLFVMAITPGICEEMMFRGLFVRMNEDLGYKKCILYTSFLFALFHFNMYNFVGPFALGILFGFITIKTNSIYPAMIGHFTNNAIATTIGYLSRNVSTSEISYDNISTSMIVFQLLLWGFIISIAVKYIKCNLKKFEGIGSVSVKCEKQNIASYIPIIIVICMYIFISYR